MKRAIRERESSWTTVDFSAQQFFMALLQTFGNNTGSVCVCIFFPYDVLFAREKREDFFFLNLAWQSV